MENELEGGQHPGKVHGLEPGAEPEAHGDVLVQLTPDIRDGQHQRVHEEVHVEDHAPDVGQHRRHDQQVQVISRTSAVLILLQFGAARQDYES